MSRQDWLGKEKSRDVIWCLREQGFCVIPVPAYVRDYVLKSAEAFYELPLEQQATSFACRSHSIMGFTPCQAGLNAVEEKFREHCDSSRGYSSFDFTFDTHYTHQYNWLFRNKWVKNGNYIRRHSLKAYKLASSFAERICGEIIEALSEECNIKIPHNQIFQGPTCSVMRFLKYAGQAKGYSKEHTDYEFISLIFCKSSGLKVKSPTGIWNFPTTSEETIVLLGGDMLEALTNGYIKSCLHKVDLSYSRISAIYFQGINLYTDLTYKIADNFPQTYHEHLISLLIKSSLNFKTDPKAYSKFLSNCSINGNLFKFGK